MNKKQFSALAKQLSKDKRNWIKTLDNLKSNPLVKKYEMFQAIYWDIPADVTKPLSVWFHNHDIIKQYLEHKSNNPISLKNIRTLVDSHISTTRFNNFLNEQIESMKDSPNRMYTNEDGTFDNTELLECLKNAFNKLNQNTNK